MLITVDKAGQQVRDLVPCARMARTEPSAPASVAAQKEVAFAGERTIQV